MAKEAYYFSHDANARTDPKILQMRSVYKSEGYGWYWMFIEKMREEADYTLSMQGKYVWNAFALEMDASAERIRTFVEDCICEFKLFESDGTKFWSNSLLERMKIRETKSEKARQSAEARWKKNKEAQENQPLEQTDSESNANASKNDAIKERKVKEIKVKENINIPYAEIIDYLNLKAGTKYRHDTSKNKELIKARWNEKFGVDEFKTVIDKKCAEWLGTEQEKYLRPETLFGAKFEGYLNQKGKGDVSKNGQHKENIGSSIDDDIIARLSV